LNRKTKRTFYIYVCHSYADTTFRVAVRAVDGASVAAVFPRAVVAKAPASVAAGTRFRAFVTVPTIHPGDRFAIAPAATACASATGFVAVDPASIRAASKSSLADPVASAEFALAADAPLGGGPVADGTHVVGKVCYLPAGFAAADAVEVTSPLGKTIALVSAGDCATPPAAPTADYSPRLVSASWSSPAAVPNPALVAGAGSVAWIAGCTLDGDVFFLSDSTGVCPAAPPAAGMGSAIQAGSSPVLTADLVPAVGLAGTTAKLCLSRGTGGAGPTVHGNADVSIVAGWPDGWAASGVPGWVFPGATGTGAVLAPSGRTNDPGEAYVLAINDPDLSAALDSVLATRACTLGIVATAAAGGGGAAAAGDGPFDDPAANVHSCDATNGCGIISAPATGKIGTDSLLVCARAAVGAPWVPLAGARTVDLLPKIKMHPWTMTTAAPPSISAVRAGDRLAFVNSTANCGAIALATVSASLALDTAIVTSAPGGAPGAKLTDICVSVATSTLTDASVYRYRAVDALAGTSSWDRGLTAQVAMTTGYQGQAVGQAVSGGIGLGGTIGVGIPVCGSFMILYFAFVQ
jgi:hypothetical protein